MKISQPRVSAIVALANTKPNAPVLESGSLIPITSATCWLVNSFTLPSGRAVAPPFEWKPNNCDL